jgi:hypothetical protein
MYVKVLQGHQDPSLWMTIVAPHAFALPAYRLNMWVWCCTAAIRSRCFEGTAAA